MAESLKEQRLWQACTDGDLETVMELANDDGVDVNWVDSEYGRTRFTAPASLAGPMSSSI